MPLEDTIGDVWDLANRIYNGREHVAGHRDWREADRIRGILEDYLGEDLELVETPLVSWRLKGVEVSPKPSFVSVAPYVLDADVEARTFMVEGDPSDYRSWRGVPEGSIAVVIPPVNPDDLKYAVLHAWESGARGVIVGSRVPRKIVATGSWGYSYTAGAPTPIPVVVVDEESAKRALWEGRARIQVSAVLREEKGAAIRAVSGGPGRVAFTSHYDRWYTGFQDNILGIAQAAVAYKRLREKRGVELLVFTGEEHGAPGPAGWYWAWGSRWLARQYREAGLEVALELVVNFDVAGTQPLVVSGAPQYTRGLIGSLRALGVEAGERCCDCPECDGFSFHRVGVPSVSIHTLWNDKVRRIYHTPMDTPENADPLAAGAAVEAAVRAALEGPSWAGLEERLEEILSPGPLPARLLLHTVLGEARKRGWPLLYKWLSSSHLRPVLYGDYRYDTGGDIEAVFFPEAAGAVKLLKGAGIHAVIEPGEERLVYQAMPGSRVEEQARETLYELLSRVRWELSCL